MMHDNTKEGNNFNIVYCCSFYFYRKANKTFFMNTSICRLSFEANAKNVGEKVPKCFLENAEALLVADGHVFDIYKFDKFDI